MLMPLHPDMKNAFDVADRAGGIHDHPIAVGPYFSEPVGLEEPAQGLIILRRGAELFRELFRGQKLPIPGASGIVQIGQKVRQSGLISQRQSNGQP
jgi:hypothetical protein